MNLPDRTDENVIDRCKPTVNSITHSMVTQHDLTRVIQLQRFSSYVKLLRVTSRVLAAAKSKSFKAICNDVSSADMQAAEKLWVKEVQKGVFGSLANKIWKIRTCNKQGGYNHCR